MQTHNQNIGKIGEDIACKFLKKRGFSILERNYWKKCGELDIVAEKNKVLHFVEVKTVSYEKIEGGNHKVRNFYRPEENIHPRKLQRLLKTIQVFLLENDVSDDTDWVLDAIVVFLNQKEKTARVRFLENIII